MCHILIIYESRTGNVKQMAEAISEGVKIEGLDVKLMPANQVQVADMLGASGIIAGTFTSYGIVAGEMKTLFDQSASNHGSLQGKVGGAFASAGELGGGVETTVISILQMMLVHGMIIEGNYHSPHFGACAIGKPDEKSLKSCRDLGKRVAVLVKKLSL
jgi:NAD(P)H dehydrogenase (quinone)